MRKLEFSKRNISPLRQTSSFTLVETLVYVAVLVIIVLATSSFFLWINRSNIKAKAIRESLHNVERALAVMTQEIKEAESIYTPTSIFDSNSGQLSLETTKYLPTGETTSYIDFYLCGTQLCFKKESQNPVALTSGQVEVNSLVFSQVNTTSTVPSIQISLDIDYKAVSTRPEYQASIVATSTASLRSR